MSLLEVRELRKSYNGTVAVDGLSFTVLAGEVLGLLGPNGAGKTTTMSMIAGLLSPDSGAVELNGREVDRYDEQRRRALGIVPQDLAVYPDLSALENLHFFGRLYGVRGKELEERADQVLEQVGLTSRSRDAVRAYSGGMKRRLNFGVALMHQPQVLILDEPTVGVDPQSRSHLLDCVRALAADGVGVIYASHYMEEVEELCARVVIVDHGRIVAADSIERLLNQISAGVRLHVSNPSAAAAELRPLCRIEELGDDGAELDLEAGEAPLEERLFQVLEILKRHGVHVRRIETEAADLERLFLKLTGRSLRD
jgi:linearmycin/streptolysin S transport system ATP-binding protein